MVPMTSSPVLPIPAEGTATIPARCRTCGGHVAVVQSTVNFGNGRGAAFVMPTGRMPEGTPGRACQHEGADTLTIAQFERLGR